MARLLLLAGIVIVVALLVRRFVTAMRTPPASERDTPPSDTPEAKLVRCVECGAFVPKADTVPVGNGFRCGAGCLPR
jgi:hypothetical protein